MNLRDFALLTDENLHWDVVAFLRGEGFDVLDVREIRIRNFGQSASAALPVDETAEQQ